MKLVIDIPDEEYEAVKKSSGCYYDFGKAIFYGTPLPKGHGRLIEAFPLIENLWKDKLDSRELISEMITNAPTIIEADKAEDLDNLDSMLKDLWNDTESEDKK